MLLKGVNARRLFLAALTVTGLFTMFAVPPLWGFDETSHFSRVYLLSTGKWLPNQKAEVPTSYNKVMLYAVANIGQPKQPNIFLRKDIDSVSQYSKLLSLKFSTHTEQPINPAGYSIFAYPLSVLLVAAALPFHPTIGFTIMLARLAGLATFIGLVYLALYVLNKNGFKKTQWVFIVVSLLPTTLFQAATLSADTLANGLAILFMALLIVVLKKQYDRLSVNKWYVIGLLSTATLLPLVKVNYVFLSLGIVFVSSRLVKSSRVSTLIKTIILLGSTLLSILLTFVIVPSIGSVTQVSPRPDGLPIDQKAQMLFVMGHPLSFIWAIIKSLIYYGEEYIREMTTVLAWNYVELPVIFTILCIILILVAVFYAKDEFTFMKKYLNWMTLFILAGVSSIFLALYIAFTPVGKALVDGVQGRYFIPFIIPTALILAANLNIRVSAKERVIRNLMIMTATTVVVGAILYYVKVTY